MCGRYTLRASPRQMALAFRLDSVGDSQPRYNIAPTQRAAIVRAGAEGKPELAMLRWGLVPSWASDPSVGGGMINARSETAAEKPAFRGAMRQRRCLIPVDGFYEWQKQGRHKQPTFIHRGDDALFAFAGLWERWNGAEPSLETFTILTTAANEQLRPLHERMPIILRPEDYDQWLDPEITDAARLDPLLHNPPHALILTPVSPRVNSVIHDDPSCIAAAAAQKSLWD